MCVQFLLSLAVCYFFQLTSPTVFVNKIYNIIKHFNQRLSQRYFCKYEMIFFALD